MGGKIEQRNKHPLKTRDDLSMVYTPGVARVCLAIADDEDKAFQYTIKRNTVAVVSDGSAVLGLGRIGPAAAMPVMEGKCCLFKEFAGVDAFPICLDTMDTDEIVRAVELIAPAFGGVNLEDISAPRCFEIEERLKEQLDIPVFHDDQHGTAVVVMAALLNAVKLTGRRLEDLKVMIIGLGAAGIAVTKILLAAGVSQIIGADSRGALHVQRDDYLDGSMNLIKRWFASSTNPECRAGAPADVIDGADLLIGVSGARALPAEALSRMNPDAMVFAMANPNPGGQARGGCSVRADHGDGTIGLPQPDQQRAVLPGDLQGRAGRACHGHHRGHEDGRRTGDRRDRRGSRAARGLHHPVGLQPGRRTRRGRRRRGRGQGSRHRARRAGDGIRPRRHHDGQLRRRLPLSAKRHVRPAARVRS